MVVAETLAAAAGCGGAGERGLRAAAGGGRRRACARGGRAADLARGAGQPLLHLGAGDAAATDAAFEAAAHTVELELVNNRVVVNTIEPRGALGVYDPASERYTLHINSQHVHGARAIIAGILGVEEDRLRILAHDLGGGFGMKYFSYPEQVLVAWAARKLGRPVRWLCGRIEGFQSDTQARDPSPVRRWRSMPTGSSWASACARWPISALTFPTWGRLADPALHAHARERLPHARDPCRGRGRAHQHRLHRCLPRRRHPGIELRGGAPGGQGCSPSSASRPTRSAGAT